MRQQKRFSSGLPASRVIGAFADARWLLLITLAVLVGSFASGPATGAALDRQVEDRAPAFEMGASAPKATFARGHILVARKSTSDPAAFEKALVKNGSRSLGKIGSTRVHVVDVAPGDEEAAVGKLKSDPDVEFAEVDRLIPAAGAVNDPGYSAEWHLSMIGAPTAWNYATGAGITIAILDTGVDGTHPDLVAQMTPGWNFYDNNSNTADVNGHGTAVAGAAAAATNNGIGVASVAGGAKIMPVRIADANAYAYWSTVAQGLTWAADNGARVANISYVGASGSSTIQSAASYFRSKGGVVFVAAGNTGAIDNTAPTSLITVVSATQETDTLASFSTYGPFVDISAPGNNIYTTARGGGYQYWWGTSLATPVVAGTAALMLSKRPDLTPAQVDSTLAATATDLGTPGYDIYYGAGRVNAAAALQQIANAPPPPPADTTSPSVSIASPLGGNVAGVVTVTVSAADNVGVTRVELRVNGVAVVSDTAAPYQMAWNSATVANGGVALTAAAYDAAGNFAVSAPVAVNVANVAVPPPDTTPPSVAIASPTGGTVSGNVAVNVNASDNIGVTRVDLLANNIVVGTTNVGPYQFAWNSMAYANGTATLKAVAYDAAGNSAGSAIVSVNVMNGAVGGTDTTPPLVTITNPANGSVVNANVAIKASATDNSGATGITQRIYIDGVLKATASGAALSYNWNAKKVASGTHTIMVTATDVAGNTGSNQVQVIKR